jgi:thymidylate synthase (FAD)
LKIIKASYEILTPIDREYILKFLERIGRVCYKSEDKITNESAPVFIRRLIEKGHESVIEHVSLTVKFICDRGISHELVRHRIASFSQESTRYCNYGNSDGGCTFIQPCFIVDGKEAAGNQFFIWKNAMHEAERNYLYMLKLGATPQEARSVLPNSLKTEVVMTANLRELRHFFKLRTSNAAHIQMRELTIPLLRELKGSLPEIFDDIEVTY